MLARQHAGDGAPAEPSEEERERRQRDELRERKQCEHRKRLAEPDRAAIAWCEQQPVHHPLLALGHEGPYEREHGGEEDHDPQQAGTNGLRVLRRDGEVKDNEARRRRRAPWPGSVSRPRSSSSMSLRASTAASWK